MNSPVPFLAFHPLDAQKCLSDIKQKVFQRKNGKSEIISRKTIVLLVAIDGGSATSRKQEPRHYQILRDTCAYAFKSTGAVYSESELDVQRFSIACGWYPIDDDVEPIKQFLPVQAAAYILRTLMKHISEQHCCSASIGRDEYAAFELLRYATAGQATLDPELFDGITLHSPDYDQYAEIASEAATKAVDSIDWDRLSLERNSTKSDLAKSKPNRSAANAKAKAQSV